MTAEKRIAYLALGSNLGERREQLKKALASLGERVNIIMTSRVYETAPVGMTEQPDFLNLVVAVETDLSAGELLGVVKQIERDLGRQAGPRWGPRVIDIDILLLGEENIDEAELQIPHPRMAERAFVMVPLAELAPNLRIGEQSAAALAARLAKEQEISAGLPI
jgi:2-amino-4-hydroxy-6-hydroxymethyldihydropteridine diphosphokinase